jgi:hypothetical protein
MQLDFDVMAPVGFVVVSRLDISALWRPDPRSDLGDDPGGDPEADPVSVAPASLPGEVTAEAPAALAVLVAPAALRPSTPPLVDGMDPSGASMPSVRSAAPGFTDDIVPPR